MVQFHRSFVEGKTQLCGISITRVACAVEQYSFTRRWLKDRTSELPPGPPAKGKCWEVTGDILKRLCSLPAANGVHHQSPWTYWPAAQVKQVSKVAVPPEVSNFHTSPLSCAEGGVQVNWKWVYVCQVWGSWNLSSGFTSPRAAETGGLHAHR